MPNVLYQARVFCSIGGFGGRDQFSNTFEFRTENPLESPEMFARAQSLGNFVAGLCYNVVGVNRVVISTIAEGDAATGAASFRSVSLSIPGAIALPEESRGIYDINHALVIARSAVTGRAGAILLRGAVTELDVQAGANGEAVLSAEGRTRTSAFNANMGNSMTVPGFENVLVRKLKTLPEGSAPGSIAYQVNAIYSYEVAGVRLVKRNHKYFDRKATT